MEKLLLTVGLMTLLGASVYMMQNQEQAKPQLQAQSGIPSNVHDLYADWKKKYNKKYADPDQDWYRLTVFNDNYNTIKAFYDGPAQTFTLDFTKFMDITTEEFVQTYLGFTPSQARQNYNQHEMTETVNAEVDHRDQGHVNPPKDQGQCGSCWAFSAVGALEGLSAQQGKIQDFSEQQLVDCSTSYGNNGCNGGLMDYAFAFVRDHGLVHQDEYKYAGRDQKCAKTSGNYKIKGFTDVKAGDCAALENALQSHVVSVAVDASNWQFYSSGVFNNCKTGLNHGVTLVANKGNAWHIKNSWSSGWGEKGFIRLAKGNTCGVCNAASYPN